MWPLFLSPEDGAPGESLPGMVIPDITGPAKGLEAEDLTMGEILGDALGDPFGEMLGERTKSGVLTPAPSRGCPVGPKWDDGNCSYSLAMFMSMNEAFLDFTRYRPDTDELLEMDGDGVSLSLSELRSLKLLPAVGLRKLSNGLLREATSMREAIL